MEERVSRIEGILEILPSRVENLDRKADEHRDELLAEIRRVGQKVDASREELSRKIDTHFRWTIGILIAGIFSIITVILTLWLKF